MFGAALMVISAVILLIEYVGITKAIASRADLSGLSILLLLAEKAPGTILILLPFAFLFGSLLAFINLNRRSELIAMRAAGVSAWRFVLPATAVALFAGILTITVLNPVASNLSDRYDHTLHKLDAVDPTIDSKVVYLRQGDGKTQVVIRADHQDKSRAGHLYGATFWQYTINGQGRAGLRQPHRRPGSDPAHRPVGLARRACRRPRHRHAELRDAQHPVEPRSEGRLPQIRLDRQLCRSGSCPA
ncbi:MAG: LptF/LptG family permease [Asticcacaulis sp.]